MKIRRIFHKKETMFDETIIPSANIVSICFIRPIWYNKNRDSPMATHRLSSMFVFEEGRVPQGMRFFSVHKFISY